MAKASDFEDESKPKKDIFTTFDTNFKITNHTRNMLQALVLMGNADSKKSTIGLMGTEFILELTPEEQQLFNLYFNAFEKRDLMKKEK